MGNTMAGTGGQSAWQQAWRVWQEARLEWQRPAGWEPADTDLQRTEPIPVVPASVALAPSVPAPSVPAPAEAGQAPLAATRPAGRPPAPGVGGDGRDTGSGEGGNAPATGNGEGGDGRGNGEGGKAHDSGYGTDPGHGGGADSDHGDGADSDYGKDNGRRGPGGPGGDSHAVRDKDSAAVKDAAGDTRGSDWGRDGRAHRPRRSRRTVLVAAGTSAAVLVVAAAGAGITYTLNSGPARGPNGLVVAHPSAQLADAQFATLPGQPGQGALPALTGVAAVGGTVVAVGSQTVFPSTRPLILASADGGRTWQQATLRIPGGGTAVGAEAVPVMIAGGYGGWLALAPGGAWTSRDGRAWLLGPGIAPLSDGDRVRALARAGSGFVAVGEKASPHGLDPGTSPVLWTSTDGLTWQRRGASQLQLPGRGGHVVALRWVAAHGRAVLVAGEISRPVVRHRGKRKVTILAVSTGVWRSTDNGIHWKRADPPVTRGATGGLAGLAATRSGFVAIRPGRTASGARDAVAYVSARSSGWRFAGVLIARHGGALRLAAVGGNHQGAVVAGSAGPDLVAFVSMQGRAWHQSAGLGRSSASTVTGVTVGPGGEVVAAGSTPQGSRPTHARKGKHPGRGSSPGASSPPNPVLAPQPGPQPFLVLVRGRRGPVGRSALVGAATPSVTVNGLGVAAGRQVAVGSVDGLPAIWSRAASGRWSQVAVAGAPPAAASGAGPGLTGVVHGRSGWLAIGGGGPDGSLGQVGASGSLNVASASASQAPILLTSPDGQTWRPAVGSGPFGLPGVAISQAAAGPAGYVVVGERVTHGQPAAALWWSPSLTSWIPLGSWTGSAPGTPSALLGVAAGRTGFAAVGAIGTHPAVWLSRSGRGWTAVRLAIPAGAGSAVFQQVAIAGRRITAVGIQARASGPVPFAAVSANGGASWREGTLPVPGGPAGVTALVAARGGFVAAGSWGATGIQDVIMWWSRDGLTWHEVLPAGNLLRGPGAQQITGLSLSGTVLNGVGYTATRTGQHPILLLARVR
jgi:hypothetical protein